MQRTLVILAVGMLACAPFRGALAAGAGATWTNPHVSRNSEHGADLVYVIESLERDPALPDRALQDLLAGSPP
jgi:hypothetical protein